MLKCFALQAILGLGLFLSPRAALGAERGSGEAVTAGSPDFEAEFKSLSQLNWHPVFTDPGTSDWKTHWTRDGKNSTLSNSPLGMDYAAGTGSSEADHEVLWTKASFTGDLRLEFDYTRLDRYGDNVCIVYMLATGVGTSEFPTDISAWAGFRSVPKMSSYFENMNTLHISYSVEPEKYVRSRRYPILKGSTFDDTKVAPEYSGEGFFQTGVTYRLTVIKRGNLLLFEAAGEGGRRLFGWDVAKFAPLTQGRVGLRQMFKRSSRYKDFRISRVEAPPLTLAPVGSRVRVWRAAEGAVRLDGRLLGPYFDASGPGTRLCPIDCNRLPTGL